MPILSSVSVRRKALAARLPIKFLVNIPVGAVEEGGMRWMTSPDEKGAPPFEAIEGRPNRESGG
jgi:hypothetical protein